MNSQKVWMIGWEYPPHNSGGLGVACQGLTESLAANQTSITFTLPHTLSHPTSHMNVITCSHPSWTLSPQPPFTAYSSVLTHSKPETVPYYPQSQIEEQVTQYTDEVISHAHTAREAFDVIHAHDWMSFQAGAELKQTTGKPFIAHVHSTEYDRITTGLGSPYIINAEKVGVQAADRVIAVSRYTKHLLVSRYGVAADKIRVVHNGVSPPQRSIDPGQHHFAQNRPVVVFMGRLTQQKGPAYFIQLARQVLKNIPDALFIMAGNGDLYHQLLLSTAHDGLSASVLFSGFIRGTDREKLLDRADVFVMPSVSEPFGLVALEAAQHHTPIIISQQAGVGEVLPSALRADFWDLERMTQLIVTLISKPQESKTQVQAQLTDLEQLTWQSAAKRIQSVYMEVFRT